MKKLTVLTRPRKVIQIRAILGAAMLLYYAPADPKAQSQTNITLFPDPNTFPIAVWLQQPRNADRFKAAGINLFVGLYRGPTAEQLALLEKSGMRVICGQNEAALAYKNNQTIVGWMHGDEPDNAQALRNQKGYGPPILPTVIQENYAKIRAADPSRPVLLNLGQGVAWDNYIGRGVRRNHPEDYPEYIKGCDIVSFDIYPAVHENSQIAGHLEYVAKGVQRLRQWSGGRKEVWNCIECTHISNPDKKATPDQIRSEVWMSLIHGSQGIIYFVHQFKPRFIEAALLEDEVTLRAITEINAEVQKLGPVLRSPELTTAVSIESTDKVSIATMLRQNQSAIYLFTCNMENRDTIATFHCPEFSSNSSVEVIGESRKVELREGKLRDEFKPYAVHLYRTSRAGQGD